MSLHKIAASAMHLYYYNSLSAGKEGSCMPKKATLKSVTNFVVWLINLFINLFCQIQSIYFSLHITVANFLFPSGILLFIHYKSFPSPFVFLLHFHTFLLVLLFLLSSSETAKYFQMLDVGLACICIFVLLGILLTF